MHHVKGDKESEAHQDAASPHQPLSWFARHFQSREIAQLHTAALERVIGSLALRGFVVSREDPLHGLFPSCLVLDLQAKRRIHWVVGTLKNLIVANKEVRNKFCQSDGSVGSRSRDSFICRMTSLPAPPSGVATSFNPSSLPVEP